MIICHYNLYLPFGYLCSLEHFLIYTKGQVEQVLLQTKKKVHLPVTLSLLSLNNFLTVDFICFSTMLVSIVKQFELKYSIQKENERPSTAQG